MTLPPTDGHLVLILLRRGKYLQAVCMKDRFISQEVIFLTMCTHVYALQREKKNTGIEHVEQKQK